MKPEQRGNTPQTQLSIAPFKGEIDLQRYIVGNMHLLEPGLAVYDVGNRAGVEFPCGGRRADLIAIDRNGSIVAVEFKVGKGHPTAIGQLLSYMAWIRRNLPIGDNPIRGMIVCRWAGEELLLAASEVPNVMVFEYLRNKELSLVLGDRLKDS